MRCIPFKRTTYSVAPSTKRIEDKELAQESCRKDYSAAMAFSKVTMVLTCGHGVIYAIVMQKEAESLRRIFELFTERVPGLLDRTFWHCL